MARDARGVGRHRRGRWASCRRPPLTLVVAPAGFIRLFTAETAVIAIGSQLLGVAAAFQFFDGLQVTTTGALRGLGETRVPM